VIDELVVTDNHPLFTRSRSWVEAGDLLPGDEIFTSRGGWVRVGNATWIEGDRALYDLSVEGSHTYFVGDTGAWAHNCVSGYSIGFETEIAARGIGTRPSHFAAANENLVAAMDADPEFAQAMEDMIPGVREAIEARPTQSPIWTWHHVQGRPGVLQLVPRSEHAGAGYGRLFHPGGYGGFSEWGALY
jgi:hypothetical protein